MRKPKFLTVLMMLVFALILGIATGCEKSPLLLDLSINIEGKGVVHQTYTTKASAGYAKDSVVMLTAQPAQMWQFSHWEGGLTGSTNPKEITISEPTAITAVFTPIELPSIPQDPTIAWCYDAASEYTFMPSVNFIALYDPDLKSKPAVVPATYDVLVIDGYPVGFPATDFTGKVIITLDYGAANFLDQMNLENYYDYETNPMLHWSCPVSGDEVGASGDTLIYHSLDDVEGFTRFANVLQAGSTEYADDIIIYTIDTDSGSWVWLHIGPHFGDYDDAELAKNRSSEIIDYVLKLLAGKNPVFPPIPAP